MKKYLVFLLIAVALIGIYVASTKYGKMMGSNSNSHGMTKGEPESGQQSIVQSHRTYKVVPTFDTKNVKPNEQVKVSYKIEDENNNVLKDFAVDHTKIMHFIAVRKDLQNFQHIHPELNKETGEFSIDMKFPSDGPYKLFADFAPADGQKGPEGMILTASPSYDLTVGEMGKYKAEEVSPDTSNKKTVNGYEVAYTFPQSMKSQDSVEFAVHVTKNSQPVTDLEEYLGAKAHAVILKKETLDFKHIHGTIKGESANGQAMMHEESNKKGFGPDITFTDSFAEPGIYKIFVQFQHEGKVITTDQVVEIK